MIVGLRTPFARHIEDRVHRLPALFNERGDVIPLCGEPLARETTQRQKIEQISPAVLCPRCVTIARQWYASFHFVPFDAVQRQRLLDALTWDLKAALP